MKLRPLPFERLRLSLRGYVLAVLGAVVIFGLLIGGEARRIMAVHPTTWEQDSSADCGVVLTGGPNRVREGLALLSQGQVKKLIISGVHPKVSLREIFPIFPYYSGINENDILLEKHSTTTYGNVQQTLALVEALRCRDLVVVTSKLHMYRAIQTFKGAFPNHFPLIQRAVIGTREPQWDELALETFKSFFYSVWAYP